MVIRMCKNMKKDIETMKNNQLEIKTNISEVKNTLEVIISRLDEAEGWIIILEDKVKKITQ